jgi:putative addiction module killer protein
MIEIRQTDVFTRWLAAQNDGVSTRIVTRLRRIEFGNFGDAKPVGGGVSELRIDYGPGFRIYFVRRGDAVVILLCAGDKKTQSRDIAKAQKLAKDV